MATEFSQCGVAGLSVNRFRRLTPVTSSVGEQN